MLLCVSGLQLSIAAQNDTATINNWNTKSFELLRSNPIEAEQLARKALAAAEKMHFTKGLSDANMRIGLLFKNAGVPDSAIKYYHKSLAYRKQMGDKDLIARACSNIGNLYHNAAVYDSAIFYHLRSVSLAEQIADTNGLIKYLNSTAIAYQKYGKPDKAKELYTQSIALAESSGAFTEAARARNNLASLFVDLEKYTLATEILRPTFKDTASVLDDVLANAYNNLGLCYLYTNRRDSAQLAFERSLEVFGDAVNTDVAAVLSNLGVLAYEGNHFKDALDYFDNSNDLADQLHMFALLATNYEWLGKTYHQLGRHNEAFSTFELALKYRDSLAYISKIEAVENVTAKYAAEKKDAEIRALQLEQQITSIDRDQKLFQRNMAILLAIVVMIMLLLLFNRRSLQKKVEYQKKLTDDRTRISADLHDDIGSALSSISMYSELAKERVFTADQAEINSYLNEIAGTSGELLDSMGDLVWAVNPTNDTMEKMLARIQTFGTRICAPHQIKFSFKYPEAIEQLSLTMEVRHCIYMIIKEAINNAVKYAQATMVSVDITRADHAIMIDVYDDGKGFDVATDYEGNGLRNIKRRAAQIQAELSLYSARDKKTGLRLVYGKAHHR